MSSLGMLWFWVIGLALTLGSSGFVFWLFWYPLRLFLYSLIPAHAAYAWVGKLVIIIFVGWLGGIVFPLLVLVFGLAILLAITSEIS